MKRFSALLLISTALLSLANTSYAMKQEARSNSDNEKPFCEDDNTVVFKLKKPKHQPTQKQMVDQSNKPARCIVDDYIDVDKEFSEKINIIEQKWLPLLEQTIAPITHETINQFERFLQDNNVQEYLIEREIYNKTLDKIAEEYKAHCSLTNSNESPANLLSIYINIAHKCFVEEQKDIAPCLQYE